MKVLFATERRRAVSHSVGGGGAHSGVAWFQLVLHEGPPDQSTWEGGGKTVAYWRDQFTRVKEPYRWRIDAPSIEGVDAAVIPDEIVESLPEDARISFLWTFIPDKDQAPDGAGEGASAGTAS